MRPLRTIRFILPALLCLLAVNSSWAQTPPPATPDATPTAGANAAPTTVYESPNISAFGMPTGLMTIDIPNESKYFQTQPTAVTSPLSAVSASSVLGCGGVGQGEYTSALFNMPEVFSKFQNDVNSPLAKALLTMNYSLPQTAALFDTLNSYGNQRYDQFQRGCSLDALKQDAKQRYLEACVAQQIPLRQTVITTNNPTVVEPLLSSEANAQAWEVCQMQYVSDTTAMAQRVSVTTAFAKEIRTAEYANTAIRSLICNEQLAVGCWQALFLPQVRVCNDPTLEKGCTDGDYGVEEAPVRLLPYFDMLRLAVIQNLNQNIVKDLVAQINSKHISSDIQRSAAQAAAAELGTQPAKDASYATVKDFEKNYLNCKSSDMLWPLRTYVVKLNALSSGAGGGGANSNITLKELDPLAFENVTSKLQLPAGGFSDDQKVLEQFVPSVIGCTAAQSVPILDPVIIAESNTRCTAGDLDAFYSVAAYDLSMAATRETYEYIISRLKDARARLLIEDTRPQPKDNGVATVVDSGGRLASKELNRRLATIIGELMIPRLQLQLDRLSQLDKARSTFGDRVKQIYASKGGCVY